MLNEDFNIDQFKKSWQEQKVPEVYQTSEIEAMLNKKSRNYVKYIFWISLAEFLLFFGITVYYIFWGDNSQSLINILKKIGIKINYDIKINIKHLHFITVSITLLITSYFIIIFYLNYKKIKIEDNLKKLIKQILKFRQTIYLVFLINILILIMFINIYLVFIFRILSLQKIYLEKNILIIFIASIFFSTILGIILLLMYYRIVYVGILKKLNRNLQILMEIETNKNL